MTSDLSDKMTREQDDLKANRLWEVVIFMVNGKANHAGLSIPVQGLADLSLLGARIVPWDAQSLPKGDRLFFEILVPNTRNAIEFLKRPGLLMSPIIRQEKACRGWHLTEDAPDYVRKFHSARSKDPADMNCVEWIARGLELGGVNIPDDVLTPSEILDWCLLNGLPQTRKELTPK